MSAYSLKVLFADILTTRYDSEFRASSFKQVNSYPLTAHYEVELCGATGASTSTWVMFSHSC